MDKLPFDYRFIVTAEADFCALFSELELIV
jgi:hypothetical protein